MYARLVVQVRCFLFVAQNIRAIIFSNRSLAFVFRIQNVPQPLVDTSRLSLQLHKAGAGFWLRDLGPWALHIIFKFKISNLEVPSPRTAVVISGTGSLSLTEYIFSQQYYRCGSRHRFKVTAVVRDTTGVVRIGYVYVVPRDSGPLARIHFFWF